MPLKLCGDCGWTHWNNDPCRTPKKSMASRKDEISSAGTSNASRSLVRMSRDVAGTQALPVDPTTPQPKRSGNRHRPGYFTEYMRKYRARKAQERLNPSQAKLK